MDHSQLVSTWVQDLDFFVSQALAETYLSTCPDLSNVECVTITGGDVPK
jgi:hypothetical protein